MLPYLLSYSRKNDKERDEKGSKNDVQGNRCRIPDNRCAITIRIKGWASIVPKQIKPTASHF